MKIDAEKTYTITLTSREAVLLYRAVYYRYNKLWDMGMIPNDNIDEDKRNECLDELNEIETLRHDFYHKLKNEGEDVI